MPAISTGKVLVSGANGFIAVWVVQDLLKAGYSVRGTVRSEAKAKHLSNLFGSYGDKFECVIVSDITKPGAFDEAVKGIDAIEHTASPFHFNAEDPNELIEPAVKGTVGILESALKNAPDLKRVVILSSCASVSNPTDTGVLDERNWNEDNIKEIQEKGKDATAAAKYRASKSLAEKSAWEFVKTHAHEIKWDLVTLCPPFVFGPTIHEVASADELNTSVKDYYLAIFKHAKTPEQVASFEGSWVDVRDVSQGHVKAIQVEEAGGHRFILTSGNFVWQDWFDTVNALKVPGVVAPTGTPGAGNGHKHKQVYSTAAAQKILGMTFVDKPTCAKATVESLKERFEA